MLNPHSTDGQGNTPLHIAAARDLLEIVVWLVEEKGSMVTVINCYNQTPMQMARCMGNNVIADYLEEVLRLKFIASQRPRIKSV